MNFLGLGKTLFNSSVTLLTVNGEDFDYEVALTERLTRSKYSGAWPEKAINYFHIKYPELSLDSISENSDVASPIDKENSFDQVFPFFENLTSKGISHYTKKYNNKLEFFSHHLSHAYSAISTSPFSECLLLVIDGGGSRKRDLEESYSHDENANEFLSLYEFKDGKLTLLEKKFQNYQQASSVHGKSFSNGIGAFYESISEFIFNDKSSAGKVMGLASFGEGEVIKADQFISYLDSLNWELSFTGTNKQEWEDSKNKDLYRELAATAQKSFEFYIDSFLKASRTKHPHYDKVIFTGGCALNCTYNWKLAESELFTEIYVPPAPGDSGISLGCAYHAMMKSEKLPWKRTPHSQQDPYKGPTLSSPENFDIDKLFQEFKVTRTDDIERVTAKIINDGHTIAWFQDRSEIGPRALGNRSILASILKPNLKSFLNDKVKFREEFRPYACSILKEDAPKVFNISKDFENPFMSFAVPIREKYREYFKEVAHIDNSNRMQIVSIDLNPKFYKLLQEIQNHQEIGALLNTSLNIMGEPIVETPMDLLRFFKSSILEKIIIGDYLIEK